MSNQVNDSIIDYVNQVHWDIALKRADKDSRVLRRAQDQLEQAMADNDIEILQVVAKAVERIINAN